MNEYPNINYFYLSSLPSEKEIRQQMDSMENQYKMYPVLSNYLSKKDAVRLLPNLIKINKFANAMLNKYSYKIDRVEAKKQIIRSAISENKDLNDESYNQFEEGWNEMINEMDEGIIKYKCRPEMKKMVLTREHPLSYTLNDDDEIGFGMYLAALYQYFAELQNSFLKSICEFLGESGPLHFFRSQITKEIYAQEANPQEVVSLDLI